MHTDFEVAFREGQKLSDHDGAVYSLSRARLGMLHINSGAVLLGDALTGLARVTPPRGAIAPGPYEVDLSLAKVESDNGGFTRGDVRVAAARIRFSGAHVTRWVEAEATAGVDSGTCAFSDGDVPDWAPASDAEGQLLQDALQLAVLGPSALGVRHAVGGRELCAFTSGGGDGIYCAWWGLSAASEPVCLCLDFEILLCSTTTDITLPTPLRRGSIDDAVLNAAGIKLSVPFFSPGQLIIECTAKAFAFPRWKMPDGQFVRPTMLPSSKAGRMVIDHRAQPANASLVIRLKTGTRQMTPV